ncbi:MAG: hypothetical protein K1X95_05405 [Acidimicrobiia bacterium]|nr:hypothetical protein [Acidimicrobiia bacterium]
MSESPQAPTQTVTRLLRGYGPLIGFAVLFLLMSLFVPTRRQEIITERVAAGSSDADSAAATGGAGAGGGAAAGASGAAAGSGMPASAGGTACPDRSDQVAGDPYSPPCLAFSGSNGGATSKGVTDTEIVIAVRESEGGGFQDALSKAAGASISDSPEDTKRTLLGLADYFNANYQFYGRKIRLEFFTGKGDPLKEVVGGGQEGAEADAIKVSDEVGAFADLSATTPPYADALSRRQIVNIGSPYMSREWYSQRAPYSWSPFTDCSIIVETVSDYYAKRLAGHPASLAQGDLAGRDRAPAVIAPENSWYQECVSAGLKIMEGHGLTPTLNEKYILDLNLMSNQAVNLVAKLKSANVTTVVCGCDPVLLLFMTGKAREQNYFPEWILTGVAFTDQDIVGQLFDQSQWVNSVGVSFAGDVQPMKASLGYNAYKSVRSDEPAFATDGLYYQMLILALGIQMAGPNLTPSTFQQGLFAYPPRTGPAGTWHFGAGDFTTSDDAREIYWDPNRRSVQNGEQGAYVDTSPGSRFGIGQFPSGEPKVR